VSKRVLFIDDELELWEDIFRKELSSYGFEIKCESDPSKAVEIIEAYQPDVVMLDIRFPGGNLGKPTLKKIKALFSDLPVMMITGTMDKAEFQPEDYALADYRYAKAAITDGDFSDLAHRLDQLIEKYRSNRLTQSPESAIKANLEKYGFVVGETPGMKMVAEMINKVADQDVTILITGESGTGKELVARAIHGLSKRRDQLFQTIVCAAIPKDLLESELFGHERGAFTGAIVTKKGKFEVGDRGTLFLDEIADMSPEVQVKLLRFLQERKFERVGGHQSIISSARIIAATNKDLKQMIQESRFREDLFFRLNVVSIHVPPLRERKEDIPLLFKYFVEKANLESGKKILPILRDDVKSLLVGYTWPGNIRELENVIHRAVALAEENILQTINFPDLTQNDKPNRPVFPDVPALIDQIFLGKIKWQDLKDTFAAKSQIRREILLLIESRWRREHQRRITAREMATLLDTTYNNMRRILSECQIRLTGRYKQ